MSLIDLRIELPAYSHSFQIQVPSSSTVLDVKREISKSCTGAPRVEGQRIIWRGRCLEDHETVDQVWTSPEELRVVHLSVHPSAWASAPPEVHSGPSALEPIFREYLADPLVSARRPVTSASVSSPMSQAPPARPPRRATPTQPRSLSNPLVYVLFKHNNALLALMQGDLLPVQNQPEMDAARETAKATVSRFGWYWPPVLDEEFPAPEDEATGVKYERTNISGQDYMTLVTPDATPTPLQLHALRVLAYTFPLLSLSVPNAVATASVRHPPGHQLNPGAVVNLNAHLQQLGLPPVRLQYQVALRPLLVPMVMLTLRAMILLYFFSPSRKPFFAIALGAWVLYEAWNAVRAVIGPLGAAGAQRPGAPAAAGAARNGAHVPQAGIGGLPAILRDAARPNSRVHAVLQGLAGVNLADEERILAASPGTSAELMAPPSLLHRIRTFVQLFVITLHPSFWDIRRVALKAREGRLRTEAHIRERQAEAREGQEEGTEEERQRKREEDEKTRATKEALVLQHARRPAWVKEYVERARRSEWADDS